MVYATASCATVPAVVTAFNRKNYIKSKMVWHRSAVRLAERADVHPALKKLWKKYYKVDGQITQHLSPFEQKIVTPLLKEMPGKFVKRSMEIVAEAGAGLALGVFVFYYGNYKHKDIAFHHRT